MIIKKKLILVISNNLKVIFTVTGASVLYTLLSSTKISLAFIHNTLTYYSFIGSHFLKISIY